MGRPCQTGQDGGGNPPNLGLILAVVGLSVVILVQNFPRICRGVRFIIDRFCPGRPSEPGREMEVQMVPRGDGFHDNPPAAGTDRGHFNRSSRQRFVEHSGQHHAEGNLLHDELSIDSRRLRFAESEGNHGSDADDQHRHRGGRGNDNAPRFVEYPNPRRSRVAENGNGRAINTRRVRSASPCRVPRGSDEYVLDIHPGGAQEYRRPRGGLFRENRHPRLEDPSSSAGLVSYDENLRTDYVLDSPGEQPPAGRVGEPLQLQNAAGGSRVADAPVEHAPAAQMEMEQTFDGPSGEHGYRAGENVADAPGQHPPPPAGGVGERSAGDQPEASQVDEHVPGGENVQHHQVGEPAGAEVPIAFPVFGGVVMGLPAADYFQVGEANYNADDAVNNDGELDPFGAWVNDYADFLFAPEPYYGVSE